MFPHIPVTAIRRDLERTRSVELTCERILRDGGLPLVSRRVLQTHND
jgi:coupling of ubiquitin conjugation to ER degradation protein 1